MKCNIKNCVCVFGYGHCSVYYTCIRRFALQLLLYGKSHIKFSLRFVFCWRVWKLKFNALLHWQRRRLTGVTTLPTSCSLFHLQMIHLFIFMLLQRCDTHPALLAVGQELVFFLGVEDESLWDEGDGLTLERRTLVCAYEQHLIPFVYGRPHQHHLWERQIDDKGREYRGQRLNSHCPAVCGRRASQFIPVRVHIKSPACTWTCYSRLLSGL